jgi:hypothetical protein
MAGSVVISEGNVWSAGSSTMDEVAERTRGAFPPECAAHVEALYEALDAGLQLISLMEVNAEVFNCFHRACRAARDRFRDEGPPPGWPPESYPNMLQIWDELLAQLERDPRYLPST